MARRTDGEKIDELEKFAATTRQDLTYLRDLLDELWRRHETRDAAVSAASNTTDRELALLRREVEELRAWKADQKRDRDERARRLWAFGPNLAGAVLTVLLSAAVAYLVSRKP